MINLNVEYLQKCTKGEEYMAKQNIYDNDSFFENFKNLRNNKINFNDCIETPILLAMIPEVDGKRVLDIGCGMGQHAKQYSDMGAESVLGIDISEKMLEYAKEHFHAKILLTDKWHWKIYVKLMSSSI